MTLGQAKKEVLMLVNEYSTRGTVNSGGNIADYNLQLPSYLNMGQRHIAEIKPIKRSLQISHYLPFTPSEQQFESVPHTDTDLIYSSGKGYAYHFAVDGDALVYVEGIDSTGDVTILDTITAYSDNGYTAFKGLIYNPDDLTFVSYQLRFSGEGFYNVKDVVLFQVKYPYYDKIPNFSRFMPYEMPDDFIYALSADIRKKDSYEKLVHFNWENPNTIAISAYEQGEIRIEYAARPKEITDTTLDTYKFEIGDYEQSAMIFYVAALCVQHTNMNVYSLLMQNYTEKMINKQANASLPQTRVKRTYV